MGSICSICIESNPDFTSGVSSDEKTICSAEKKCPISKKSLASIRKSLHDEAHNGRLTLTQMKKAGGNLGINREELHNPDSETFVFLTSLGDENSTEEKLTLVSGILICNSSTKEKALALSEIYDVNTVKILSKNELSLMFSDLFDVSIKNLPLLAMGTSSTAKNDINSYLKQLIEHREKFVDDSVDLVLKGQPEISLKRFAEILSYEGKHLVSSSGIRCEVFKKYVTKRI